MIYTKETFAILLEKQAFLKLSKLPIKCSRALCSNLAEFPCEKCSGWDSYCSKRCQEQDLFVHRQFCSEQRPRDHLAPRDVLLRLNTSRKSFGYYGTVVISASAHGPNHCQEVRCPCKTFRYCRTHHTLPYQIFWKS